MKLFGCFLVVLMGLSFAAQSKDRETITWLIWELSPEFIRYGEFAGQGFADKFLKHFIRQLPQYNHKITWVGIKRFHVEALKPNRCTPHIWKAFHLDKFKYSKRYMLTPPHVAIFPKRFESEIGPEGSIVSIDDLLGKMKYRLITPVLSMDQPRYPILHPYLKKYKDTPQIIEMKDGSNEIDLRLIDRGRGDFALGYDTAVTAQRRDRNLQGEFVTYAIKEHQQYKGIHVACLGNQLGQKVISQINTILDQKTLRLFLSHYEDWNNKDANFNQAFHDKILDGALEN